MSPKDIRDNHYFRFFGVKNNKPFFAHLLNFGKSSFKILSIRLLGLLWCLIVPIPDLCPLSYFADE